MKPTDNLVFSHHGTSMNTEMPKDNICFAWYILNRIDLKLKASVWSGIRIMKAVGQSLTAYSQLPMINCSEVIIDDDQFGSVVDFLFSPF